MRRHELTDEQFAILESYLPPSGTVGHPWEDHRRILKACSGSSIPLHNGATFPSAMGRGARSMTAIGAGVRTGAGIAC